MVFNRFKQTFTGLTYLIHINNKLYNKSTKNNYERKYDKQTCLILISKGIWRHFIDVNGTLGLIS